MNKNILYKLKEVEAKISHTNYREVKGKGYLVDEIVFLQEMEKQRSKNGGLQKPGKYFHQKSSHSGSLIV